MRHQRQRLGRSRTMLASVPATLGRPATLATVHPAPLRTVHRWGLARLPRSGPGMATRGLMAVIDETFMECPWYGSPFTWQAFTSVLREAKVRISMDGRGRWMDNVVIERLWPSLKYECVYLHAPSRRIGAACGSWPLDHPIQHPASALGPGRANPGGDRSADRAIRSWGA